MCIERFCSISSGVCVLPAFWRNNPQRNHYWPLYRAYVWMACIVFSIIGGPRDEARDNRTPILGDQLSKTNGLRGDNLCF